MKRIFSKQFLQEYWRNLMHSTCKKMSLGAQAITKLITHARGDNWRRKNEKK
jgi:hypothetical protein